MVKDKAKNSSNDGLEMKTAKLDCRWGVLLPGVLIFIVIAAVGILNNELLSSVSKGAMNWLLDHFGWLYQYTSIFILFLVAVICCSKVGNIRLGGKDAKPTLPFWTWFAMALTGGVATGIVTWGINEPLIYFGNVWGELNALGIEPLSAEAARFALGRVFYHWTLMPYAIYALTGVLVGYLYFNKKRKLTVSDTLTPLFGDRVSKGWVSTLIDLVSIIGIGLGITSGLGICISTIASGFGIYGLSASAPLMMVIGVILVVCFTLSSYVGLDKGLKRVGGINAKFYYGLMILLFVIGPTTFILRNSTAGLATWFQNFWEWGLDPIDIGGEALTRSWSLYNWAVWIAFAPVAGLFLSLLSRGRTIREFMIANWILPSVFGFVWFSIFGNTAIHMQMSGTVDLVAILSENGATSAMWAFLQNLPFRLGVVLVPLNMFILAISFITAADATLTNLGSLCIKDVPIGTQPPARIKVLWGVVIGVIATVLAAFGGGEQGVDGMKAFSSVGGSVVLIILILQIISACRTFFKDKLEE